MPLAERSKDATEFPSALASFATRAAKSGRRICGQEKAKDVLSPQAQQKIGFKLDSLPTTTATSQENLYGTFRGERPIPDPGIGLRLRLRRGYCRLLQHELD